jgi:hypothetical protein
MSCRKSLWVLPATPGSAQILYDQPLSTLSRASFDLHRSLTQELDEPQSYGFRALTTLGLSLTESPNPLPFGSSNKVPDWVDGLLQKPRTIGTPIFAKIRWRRWAKHSVLMRAFSSSLAQKTHVSSAWVHFRLIRQSNWTKGGRLQIFATFLGAIEAIETLVPELQIDVNIRGVNCSFLIYIYIYGFVFNFRAFTFGMHSNKSPNFLLQ